MLALILLTTFTASLMASSNLSISLVSTNSAVKQLAFSQTIERINTQSVRDNEAKVLALEITNLSDYALFPYLEYELLKHQVSQRSPQDILDFMTRYRDLPFIPTLRRYAINKKYHDQQWQAVIALHKAGNSAKYQCMYLDALINNNQLNKALSQITSLWKTGQSLPERCDSVLARWAKSGKKTQALIKHRIELAFKARNNKLVKYLAKSLDKANRESFNYWHALYKKPSQLEQLAYWKKKGHTANVMMYIAFERLSYQKPLVAAKLVKKMKRHWGFTSSQKSTLLNKLVLRLLTNDHINDALEPWLNEFDWKALNNSQRSQILRHLVGLSHWQHIDNISRQHLVIKKASLEWQYWHSIALLELGQVTQATKRLTEISHKRRYYGFLASDILERPYSLNHQALAVDQKQIDRLLTQPHAVRAYQLYQLGRNLDAQREWYYFVRALGEEQRISAAQAAHEWGWHDRAIITLTMTPWRDDLDLRFPMPHLAHFETEAKRNEINLSWPLAIARQESAFMTKANSAAGARGLMQLMPGTAKLQAKHSKVLYHQTSQLYKPSMNIRLGTGYLEQMLQHFDNNLAVAAAAYNAGPHRVKHWVTNHLPQAQWIETIPFRETREYVKNVLAYSVIYQQRLSQQVKLPSTAIAPERMSINAK